MSRFKVGDEVYCEFGKGVVKSITKGSILNITVEFYTCNKTISFYKDGKYLPSRKSPCDIQHLTKLSKYLLEMEHGEV